MLTWYEAEELPLVHADAFGGRVYRVDFTDTSTENEMGEDRPEDSDHEEDAEELALAKAARTVYLVVYPSGDELWTQTGEAFALSLLRGRGGETPTLFD